MAKYPFILVKLLNIPFILETLKDKRFSSF